MTTTAPRATAVIDRRFPALNAVRGAGALMVVTTHAAFNTGRINHGWTGAMFARFDFGVALFFVLSGFLLSRPFFLARARGQQTPSARHYLWKRALRILPLYWVVVVVAMLFDPANDHATWGDWISQLTLTQLYRHGLLASSLTQMWSLCTEVAFYLVLPLLCPLLLLGRRGLHLPTVVRRAALLGILGVAWQTSVAPTPGHTGHYAQWLPGLLPWFLAGMMFAAGSADLTVRPRPHALDRIGADLTGCWILASALFAIAWSPIAGPRLLLPPGSWEAGFKTVLYGAAAALYVLPLVFGPEREGRMRAFLASSIPVWLGDISYGVFAVHMLVLNAMFRVLGIDIFTGHFTTILVSTLAITLVAATASYHLFEKRVLRFKNARFVARLDGRPPVEAPT